MQKVTPHLWFDNQAEEAVNFYISVFNNSKIRKVIRYGKKGARISGRPRGTVMTIAFQLEGQDFVALNDGPIVDVSPDISFIVNCESQAEIDSLWEKLSKGGKIEQCGWLKDKYNVSWQIVPADLDDMVHDEDGGKSDRVMKALHKMKKIDIKKLREVYEQQGSEQGRMVDNVPVNAM